MINSIILNQKVFFFESMVKENFDFLGSSDLSIIYQQTKSTKNKR